MRNSRLTKILAVTAALGAGAVAGAPSAEAYGTPVQGPCPDRVTKIDVAAPATLYVANGRKLRSSYGQDVWVYLETNNVEGLQREDAHCDDPGASHDTVLASTRIICTCDYPFGYFPMTLVSDVMWQVWWQLLPVLLLLPPLPI